ncbi:MAG TPA: hypothetical protein VH853_21775 [Polyangia bacterium]|nr:hypothetical protein [Polyangia bacterium]
MNHLAYTGRARATLLVAGSAAALWLGAVGGCTAGVKPSTAGQGGSGATVGQGGSGATGGGTGGRVVVTGSGGGGGDIVMTGTGGMITADGGCMADQLTHTPTLPTVMILVDLSGSEFDTATTGVFFNLRPAVEQVVMQLQGQVRFGIASFVGDHASGSCKLDYQQVAPDLNNYSNIKTAYDSWGPLQPYGSKADTPMSAAIPMVEATLQADATNGPKYMMLVTDSETDFCDDGNALCPADAITYEVQNLYNQTPSIGTLVIGIPDTSSPNQIEPQVLKNLANAGVGQGTGIPTGSGASTATDFWYQCNGSMTTGMSWQSLFTSAGRTGMTSLANYTTVGTASAFTPSDTSTATLVTQISTAVNTIPPSCVFDLSTLNNPIKVDLTKLSEGGVFLNGASVPLDPNNMNGWDMISDTELELFGSACTTYQNTGSTESLNLEFPCDLVITIDKP